VDAVDQKIFRHRLKENKLKNEKRPDFLFITVIVIYLILIGFFREHVFVNVNYQSSKLFYHDSFDYSLPSDMKWLENFSYKQLYYFKFPLTFVFTLLYFLPAYLTVKRFFPGKKHPQLTLLVYAFLFILALFVFGIGLLFGGYEKCYSVSRYLMGFVQSPLLMMILVPVFMITKTQADSPK
jgi:hypothetical protein